MRNIMIALILGGIIGCGTSEQRKIKVSTDLKSITALQNIPRVNVTDTSLLKEVTYVPLEVTNKCIIGEITKILSFNKRFYIFDKNRATIFVFELNGNFLFKIHSIGKGPGEYIEPLDMDVDVNGNIFVLDNGTKKIIKYSNDGKKFKEFRLEERFEELYVVSDDKVLFKNLFGLESIKVIVGFYGLKDKKMDFLISGRKLYDDFAITRYSVNSLFKSNDILYFSPRFTNKIYKVLKNEVVEAMHIDTTLVPPKFFVQALKENSKMAYTTDDYIIDIKDIYENSGIITMKILKGFPQTLLISKRTDKKIITVNFNDKKYFGDNDIHGVSGDEFISCLSTSRILEKNWINDINTSSLSPKVKNKLMALNINSNPVLVLLKFKEF